MNEYSNGEKEALRQNIANYRNLVWLMIFSLLGTSFGYAFFIHSQVGDIQRAQDRRDLWWSWVEKENAERKGEIRSLQEQINQIRRETRPHKEGS
jgi:hypothetical protein